MYRELFPLRQALSVELKADLPPAGPGIDSEHLLQSYLDRLTMYVGCDVACIEYLSILFCAFLS
jgi:hypothetical protein